MRVSLDGGETWLETDDGVTVIFDSVRVPGESSAGELHINLATNGTITEILKNCNEGRDHNVWASATILEEIVGRLVDDSGAEKDATGKFFVHEAQDKEHLALATAEH
jgi:hypothetical protein